MHENGSMMAIRNGTAEVYRVDQVWYHPGVRRKKTDTMSIRSQKPEDGVVDPRSPDVAVLHLAEGPDLNVEFPLASPDEIEDCFAQPVGMLGYPGHDTEGWPGIGEKAQATLREGIVCRVSDFYGRVNLPSAELQFVQHSMTSWFGFSGSPIFLTNGHVIALNNSVSAMKRGEHQIELAYGIRVDCLWELLAHHKLDEKVSVPVSNAKLLLERYERPDPEEQKLSRARQLVKEAQGLLAHQKFSEAAIKCKDAIELCPGYAEAYRCRSDVYSGYASTKYSQSSTVENPIIIEENIRYHRYSLADAKKYMEMNPNDPAAILNYCVKWHDLDLVSNNWAENRSVFIGTATKLINDTSLADATRAEAYELRACALADRKNNLEIKEEILADFAAALRVDPYRADIYYCRAQFFETFDSGSFAADRRQYEALIAAEAAYVDAWRLATSPDDKIRDGRKAWNLANQACAATDFKKWNYVDCMAAAYAESGDFEHAIEWASKAIDLAPENERPACRRHLKAFEQQKPWREE
jgi:tetratricopeptide (TPR) repeat protein